MGHEQARGYNAKCGIVHSCEYICIPCLHFLLSSQFQKREHKQSKIASCVISLS